VQFPRVLLERIDDIIKEISNDTNKRITSDNKTILHLAAEYDKKKVVMWALKNNANVDLTMALNQTPLMLAALQGHAEIVQLLISHKNNINDHESHTERPPLWIAINRSHKSVVKVLLENNANPNVGNLGRPCLHEAIRKGLVSVAKMLLAAGANPMALDTKGNTPLHFATMMGNKDFVCMLVEALLNVKNGEGKSAGDLIPLNCVDKDEIIKKLSVPGST